MRCATCATEFEGPGRCPRCGGRRLGLAVGSLFAERYEILALLGRGGMGEVYKARDRELEETVALKVLRPELTDTPDIVRRFRAETRLARRVRHRNVCAMYDFGHAGDTYYLTMEYVEGVDLQGVVRAQNGLPTEEAFDTALQAADALAAIHQLDIVHRDLKTSNLMRDVRGVVRVMDFGIAKQLGGTTADGQTAVGLIVGTPEYMSPEQIRGEPVDVRADLYAFGVVVFELFTGRVPFRANTPMATALQQLRDPPPLDGPAAAQIPAPLVPVLRKALAKDLAARYASIGALAAALRMARDGVVPPGSEVDSAEAPDEAPTVILPAARPSEPDFEEDLGAVDAGPASPGDAPRSSAASAAPSTGAGEFDEDLEKERFERSAREALVPPEKEGSDFDAEY
jgi:serine/threonine protein kinase